MPNTVQIPPAAATSGSTVIGNEGGNTSLFTMSGLKSAMALNNVENTALSTWAGSTNLNTVANGCITLAKMANLSQNQIIGRYGAGSGAPQALTIGAGLSLNTTTGELTAPGGSSGSFQASGTGSVSRSMQDKVREYAVSILDFGGDPSGATDCTTAFNNAKNSGAREIYFPKGDYRFNSTIVVDKNLKITGAGRTSTYLHSYVSGNNHGMRVIGDSALGTSNSLDLREFTLIYEGTGQTSGTYWCGMFIQRKVNMYSVAVEDFTNDGAMFAPSNADVSTGAKGTIGSAPFFSYIENCYFRRNGRDGFWCRMGANAGVFVNCQFNNNGRYGFHHFNDSPDDNAATASTYGNAVFGGQASYNTQEGYYLENGTDFGLYWCYAEFNGSPTNTNADGYTNTPYDFFVGDGMNRSNIQIGVLFGGSSSHVRIPTASTTIAVYAGGNPLSTWIPKRAATVSSVSAADATDLASVITLANQLKSRFNTLRTNMQASNALA